MVKVTVEKWWKNLRESLWVKCGKKFGILWKNKFYTKSMNILHIDLNFVESFTDGFAHKFLSVKWVVLHIFHIVYYYNY